MPLRSAISTARADDPAARTCNLHYIRRELGQHKYSDRRMVAYLTGLIADHGFPPPLPSARKGGDVSKAVHRDSRWIRAAVDAWLDDGIPPPQAASIAMASERKAHAAAALDMDAMAGNLRLVGGRDFGGRDFT